MDMRRTQVLHNIQRVRRAGILYGRVSSESLLIPFPWIFYSCQKSSCTIVYVVWSWSIVIPGRAEGKTGKPFVIPGPTDGPPEYKIHRLGFFQNFQQLLFSDTHNNTPFFSIAMLLTKRTHKTAPAPSILAETLSLLVGPYTNPSPLRWPSILNHRSVGRSVSGPGHRVHCIHSQH